MASSPLPTRAGRLAMRQRPTRPVLMRQNWDQLLFMHWPVPVAVIQPHLPAGLEVDTFDGQAWIAVVPFTMWGIRAGFLPAIPGLRAFHELNVRTYVHCKGVPGVWFFSLDAASLPAVWGARLLFHLPYYHARMALTQRAEVLTYTASRCHGGAAAADFSATWTVGAPLPPALPDSLTFFLTERYCLYAANGRGQLYRGHVYHSPWPLAQAELTAGWHSTMVESHGLPTPVGAPLLHYAAHVAVEIWALERV